MYAETKPQSDFKSLATENMFCLPLLIFTLVRFICTTSNGSNMKQ